ncbi:hypothetical protein LTR70_006433 [Exophiala xenobiotica]|uniref:RWD domain-containing protein n=1 Tax=Lithohypha guttulata TaxID=1690604 RepID=A0ABR0K207_9EURO|nr:hypothetical protein LTR24_007705 [Lithohypha guttulata]KAK5315979.1 hypothetical protein LTR70_006433 [Exophiala xenobiotica]
MSLTSQGSVQSNETFGKDASFKLSQLIGSMSISPASRDVVLGSKEGLHIIDLDSPYAPPRLLPHRTPWEVADVQWSPFADRDYWVVSTSNQKALVWNLNLVGWRNSIEHVLHGHTRAITDINFSAHHPDKLATCSVDSFVHSWDLRCPSRPTNSFSDWFAGATQVKWSRQDEHVIASSHDKFLHIWDVRKGAYPARTIEAHDTKIYGIDWNRFEPSKIVTCSLDKTIKVWDTNNEGNVPEKIITTDFPVWRARHTPFGYGLMVMPQRSNGDLHLYDRRVDDSTHEGGRAQPVHIFPGHKGQVKEFLWRAFGTVKEGIDHRDFQLVSWGTDHDLRLHAVPEEVFTNIGYEKGVSRPQRLRFTRRGAKYRTFRDEPTEQDAALTAPPRADSFPASNQFLRAKGRPSTNMGMNRSSVAQFKGWLQAGNSGRRTDMHGKGAGRPDTDPISWMKNVKIASWDTDALADELTSVGEKFKNVDFESIDVSQRKATMSLESPWGETDSTSAYTRVDFKFPKAYPRDARAIIQVQRTNLITAETQKKLSEDIQKIAEVHKIKGRGCVEATVRYLLKEQSLDQIITWVMRDCLTDSKIIEAADTPQDMSDDSDDDQAGSVPKVNHNNPNINVPLAKGCAAVWAENGKLVCFFRPKNREPASFLSTLGTGQLDESDSSKLFGGFGKFQVDLSARKARDISQSSPDGSDSEDSDRSSVFTSSTSSSDSSVGIEERNRFVPWQRTTLDSLQRGKSADGSQKSTTLDGTKAGDVYKPTVISIHDLSDMLPASQAAAQSYQLKETLVGTCEHNRTIAERHSLNTAAMVWRLLQSVSTPAPSHNGKETPGVESEVLALVERAKTVFDEGRDPNPRESALGKGLDHMWLEALLRTSRLTHSILQYFDQIADIQMLAMLAAIYLRLQHGSWHQSVKHSVSHPSLVGSTPSDAHDVAQALRNVQDRRLDPRKGVYESHRRTSITGGGGHGDVEMSTSVPTTAIPIGFLTNTQPGSGAPSVITHDPSGFVSAIHSTVTSLAASPESHRLSRKSDSFAAVPSQARSRAASPPAARHSAQHHKSSKSLRASPDDSFFNDARSRLKTSLSLVNVPGYEGDSNKQHLGRDGLRSTFRSGETETPMQKPRKKKLKTRFYVPIPGPRVHGGDKLSSQPSEEALRQCLNYLQQYIGLLEVWQLWTQWAELKEISAQTSNMLGKLTNDRISKHARVAPRMGLEMRRCCWRCGDHLAPVEKNGVAVGWHCVSQNCHKQNGKVSKKQHCSVCEIVITGLSVPCLQCRHLTCYDCAQGWFGQVVLEDRKHSNSTTLSNAQPATGEVLGCPTGCGCSCSRLGEITVPYPDTTSTEVEQDLAFATPRSEGYDDSSKATAVFQEHRSHRGHSVGMAFGAPDSAFNALLALQSQPRHRSISSTDKAFTGVAPVSARMMLAPIGRRTKSRDNSISTVDELLPWADDQNATLGKGLGGGLSRGLSNKGSDSTIKNTAREQ